MIEDQEIALAALQAYPTTFPIELETRLRAKLGLSQPQPEDRQLIEGVLTLLAQEHVDTTIFWRRLSHYPATGQAQPVRDMFRDPTGINAWLKRFDARLNHEDSTQASDMMLRTNPKFVLRNHLGELAIRQASLKDFSGVARLLSTLENPFEEHPGFDAEADFPPDWANTIEISCSS